MNFTESDLEEYLLRQERTKFPSNATDYVASYRAFAAEMAGLHRDSSRAADMHDGGYITDHGPDHIRIVIDRATKLVRNSKIDLTAYEILLLLLSIHIHDAGHIHGGRANHVKEATRILNDVGKRYFPDAGERKMVREIATAHGSRKGETKDTISPLAAETTMFTATVRLKALAAILRLADELAEDPSRASRYLLENKILDNSSEIYHAYALSLHSTTIDHQTRAIKLDYLILKESAQNRYGKNKKKVYLIDEIIERTLKMHRERKYCMMFLNSLIEIDRIEVKIEFLCSDNSEEFHTSIRYVLVENGYPDESKKLGAVCDPIPKLANGLDLNGVNLKSIFKKEKK